MAHLTLYLFQKMFDSRQTNGENLEEKKAGPRVHA